MHEALRLRRLCFFDFATHVVLTYPACGRTFDNTRPAPGIGMSLTLAMLRCPDDVAPETRTVAGGEFSIGRGPENDWVVADPERALSKRHCLFAFRAGVWQVAHLSTNGTFLNREGEPIGRGQARDLRSGDRLSFGAYEIEVRIEQAAAARRPAAGADPFAARRSAAPELFALDPFATPAMRAEAGLATDLLLGGAPGADPFAPQPAHRRCVLAAGRPLRVAGRLGQGPRTAGPGAAAGSGARAGADAGRSADATADAA